MCCSAVQGWWDNSSWWSSSTAQPKRQKIIISISANSKTLPNFSFGISHIFKKRQQGRRVGPKLPIMRQRILWTAQLNDWDCVFTHLTFDRYSRRCYWLVKQNSYYSKSRQISKWFFEGFCAYIFLFLFFSNILQIKNK